MSLEQRETLQVAYEAGKMAFERGQYRLSVEQFEQAKILAAKGTRQSGDVQMWLVMAYQASGQGAEAIALCKRLTQHPHADIRKEAKRLLYILQAPQLNRPKEWLSEIPDLGNAEVSLARYRQGSGMLPASRSPKLAITTPDSESTSEQENQFVWVALGALVLGLAGFAWLG